MAKIDLIAETRFRDDNVEAEILAYALRKKPVLISKIDHDWFASEAHQTIVKFQQSVKAQMAKGTLYSHLVKDKKIPKGDTQIYRDALNKIYKVNINTMSDKGVRLAIETVIELYEGRKILYGVKELIEQFPQLSVPDMKRRMKEYGSGVKAPGEIESGDFLNGFDSRLENIQTKRQLAIEGKFAGITTGIRAFDSMIGGLMPSEFGVIAGQPGVGKSAMLGSFALEAYKSGKNVLIVTGEMPKQDFEYRLDSDMASIPAIKFRWGNLSKKEITRWKKMIEYQREHRDNFLEIVSFPRNFNAADIEGHALQLQDLYEQELDLVCLDYLNIMKPVDNRHGSKDWQGQADAVWDVKSMCAELNDGISLWTAGQLTDDGIKTDKLDLSMLKYSRAIAETAPVVLGLLRTQDDEEENVLEMQVLKMRNAPLPERSIILHPNMEYMRIHEQVISRNKDMIAEGANATRRR